MHTLSTFIFGLILALLISNPVTASDVDSDAYVIYVDPVTGIEMTKPISTATSDYFWDNIFVQLAIGGVVIISGLLVAGMIKRRNLPTDCE